jgi:DNA-binding transcriptional ArsR family regulator
MTRIVDITDRDMVRALSHPLRRQVLAALRSRAASPAQLAKELDVGLGTVSYHFRQLADAKLIELVEERPRRGATEHFYIAAGRTVIPEDVWSDLPRSAQDAVASSWLAQVGREAAESLSSDEVDPAQAILTRAVLRLDDAALARLRKQATKLYDLALELEEAAQARLTKTASAGHQITLITMMFPAATGKQPSGRRRAKPRNSRQPNARSALRRQSSGTVGR